MILEIDKSTIEIFTTTSDLVFDYAKITDQNRTVCPMDESKVSFSLEGIREHIGDYSVKTEAGIASILLKTQPMSKCKINAISSNLERTIKVFEKK